MNVALASLLLAVIVVPRVRAYVRDRRRLIRFAAILGVKPRRFESMTSLRKRMHEALTILPR